MNLAADAAVVAEPETEAKQPQATRPEKKRRQRIPDNLPVIEEVIDPKEALEAPSEWRCIGQEVSEQLDYEPARFLRRRIVRRKYVHTTDPDRPPIIAPLPQKLQDRSVAGPGLLAQVLVSKYCDHLPTTYDSFSKYAFSGLE